MTSFHKIIIALGIVASVSSFDVSSGVFAQEGTSSASSDSSASSTSSGSLSSQSGSGQLLAQQKMEERRERNNGFWADMMNYRGATTVFRRENEIRREKRREKRLECHSDVRTANRDTLMPLTINCFRAIATLDLETLRKEKQYVDTLPGIGEDIRAAVKLRIQNLTDAISTVIRAMDAGVFEEKESLMEAKKNLGSVYAAPRRLAMRRLAADRAGAWLNHLIIRLHDVQSATEHEATEKKITEAIHCLESLETTLSELLLLEDSSALIMGYRQAQSDAKLCIDIAREAHLLNKEVEQAAAQNSQ